jgi:hypothetical protein
MRCCYVRFPSAIRDRKLVGPNRRFLNWSHGLPVGRQSFPELPDARYKCLTVARERQNAAPRRFHRLREPFPFFVRGLVFLHYSSIAPIRVT